MEKFAVDLDKVLDELELSEDRAEQMVHHNKEKYDLTPEPLCNYLKGDAALGLQSAGDIDSMKTPLSKREFNLTSVFQFSQDVPQKKLSRSNIHQENTESFPQTDHKHDSNTSSERCPSNTKLNVNTVFSCLQEYINTGNVNVTQKNSVGNSFILKGESNKYAKESNTYACQGSLDNEHRQAENAVNFNHRDDFSRNVPNSQVELQHASYTFHGAYSCKEPSDHKEVQCDTKDRNDTSNQSTGIKHNHPVVHEVTDHKSVYFENKDVRTSIPSETHVSTGFRMSMDNSFASSEVVSDESSPLEKLEYDFQVSFGKSHLSDSLNVEKKYEGFRDQTSDKDLDKLASSVLTTNIPEVLLLDDSRRYETLQETLPNLSENSGPVSDCYNAQLAIVFKTDQFSKEELTECLRELEHPERDEQKQVFDVISSEAKSSVISNNNDTSAEITSTSSCKPALACLPVSAKGTGTESAVAASTSQSSSDSVSLPCVVDPEVSSSTAVAAAALDSTSECAVNPTVVLNSSPSTSDYATSDIPQQSSQIYLAALGSSEDNVTSITVNSSSCSLVTNTTVNPSAAISDTLCDSVNDCDTHIVTSSVKEHRQVDTDCKCSNLECDSTRNPVEHSNNALGNEDFPVINENGAVQMANNGCPSEAESLQTDSFISVETNCPTGSSNMAENSNTISANVLSAQHNTSNVHSVLSIECQQTNTKIFGKDRVLLPTNISKVAGSDDKIGVSKACSSDCEGDSDGDSGSLRETKSSLDPKVTLDYNGEDRAEEYIPKHTHSSAADQSEELGATQISAKQYPQSLALCSKITVESQERTEHTTGNHEDSAGESNTTEHAKVDNSVATQYSSTSNDIASPDASESSIEVAASPLPFMQTNGSNEEPLNCLTPEERNLGKVPPFWVPDGHAPVCMLCNNKFTVLKRRHHCRACGKVFCSKCCNLKFRLDYMDNSEARVCQVCYTVLARVLIMEQQESESEMSTASGNMLSESGSTSTQVGRQPNPNNPMEYCSTIPPLEQVASSVPQPVPSVLVPVGVLKREGCNRYKNDVTKQVIFSDGIRPGGDLMELDRAVEPHALYERAEKHGGASLPGYGPSLSSRPLKGLEANTRSYIPSQGLPPLASIIKGDLRLEEVGNVDALLEYMQTEPNRTMMFALNKNLFVDVKILNLECCLQRTCWCFSTVGMSCVGQDEIMILVEYSPESIRYLRDVFSHLNNIYLDASQGNLLNEMGHTTFKGVSFFGSTDHGGFMFIRPSFQCLQKLILPDAPYLVGILIHRWEIPWAKVFPIRLMLRLGAEFRYYPCMLVSVPHRKPVYGEIGHTIMNLLTDFRNLSYTLPSVRGMVIHMEDRHTSILLPKNRYDQVTQALNNSNDHVLALAANFSLSADSHLVCVQSPSDDSYHTQAINIHNKPREVTGASFVVFNGALKTSSNLTAKSRIVEDGLMVQITQDMIQELRTSLHKMQDFTVRCGPINAASPDETVDIKWVNDDKQFNIGVLSVIDNTALNGVPSIRVHNGSDYLSKLRLIRWTEVFILQSGDKLVCSSDPLDISRVSENLATATCIALCDYLDLLAQGGLTKIAVRASIHNENVGYVVGSRGEKLPPIYMKSLDNALVPVLHRAASLVPESPPVVLELIFHIMLQ